MTWLTRDGVVAALGVGLMVTWGLSWRGLGVLAAFFVSGSLLTRFAEGRGARRNARQVIANGGTAAVAALFGSWTAAVGALAAATADTWATEIGAFSPVSPRLISTGRRVTRGTSGAITVLGTLGGVMGAALIAGLAQVLHPRASALGFARAAGAGVTGMVVDSVLGATAQGQYACPACHARFEHRGVVCHAPVRLVGGARWLDNDAVNLAATVCGAAAAVLATRLAGP
ncbi:MAG TPA: DUF92 domain-containing protein [Gemmatimonadales bacterium]|nr:DUF92 domain-containing protein [Gemmatimonadales bacterium]